MANENEELDNATVEEDDYYEEIDEKQVQEPSSKKRFFYPREYPDPSDIYLNKSNVEEYYFNIEKTLRANHFGWLWNILPNSLKDKIEDWVWDKDFLHDIAIKQHDKAERLNSLTASGQLAHDITNLFIKVGIVAALVFGIFGYHHFIAVPNEMFSNAISLLEDKKYTEAKVIFEELEERKNANIYVGYCTAQIAVQEKRFDDAIATYEKLGEYAHLIKLSDIELENLKKECTYQKAIDYYNNGEWQKAIDTLVPIIKYSNAIEYYEKCQYKVADLCYEDEDYYAALDKFNSISAYSDSQDRMNGIMSNIYTQGMNKYLEKDYMGAAEIFNSIVDYGYKDSGQMSTQCFYQSAQDLFLEDKYVEAKELFEQIPQYKDSQTMVKECLYRTLDSKDYTKNIINMLSLEGYRDIADTLKTIPYNIYAEWLISDIDGRAANNETFIFNTNGEFLCNEPNLPAAAVSSDSKSYRYLWDEERNCFSTEDDRYQIYIEDYKIVSYTSDDYSYITLKCVGNDREALYRCQKINELDEYYEATVVVDTSDTSDYELIQAYLDALKKKDEASKPEVNDDEPNPDNPDTLDEPDTPDNPNSPDEPDKPDTPDNPDEPSEDENPTSEDDTKTKTFVCKVLRVYNDALLVTPDSEYRESEISDRFIILYENSTDLAEGDIVSVMYKTKINTDIEPYEIEAYKVKFISSSEPVTQETESTSSNDEAQPAPDETDENNEQTDSGFYF